MQRMLCTQQRKLATTAHLNRHQHGSKSDAPQHALGCPARMRLRPNTRTRSTVCVRLRALAAPSSVLDGPSCCGCCLARAPACTCKGVARTTEWAHAGIMMAGIRAHTHARTRREIHPHPAAR
jgi:hypothetical protein